MLPLLFASFLLGCQETAKIYVDDYNVTCVETDDCIAILTGDVCDCKCTYDAINKDDHKTYKADVDAIECSGARHCAPCEMFQVTCEEGTCQMSDQVIE